MNLSKRILIILTTTSKASNLPSKAYKGDAGFDVYSPIDFTLKRHQKKFIPLDFKLQLPKGTYMQFVARSSYIKKEIFVPPGIIDEGYRALLSVPLWNLSKKKHVFKAGERVAQMVIHPYDPDYYFELAEEFCDVTERGEKGFGSSKL